MYGPCVQPAPKTTIIRVYQNAGKEMSGVTAQEEYGTFDEVRAGVAGCQKRGQDSGCGSAWVLLEKS